MPNNNQAPIIKYNGEKYQDQKKWGKAIRTHELETAIMCGLDARDIVALKIMFFLTGNAEGFGVAEKTICDRCKISERAYKTAREKLVKKGWITHIPSKAIIVNYDQIFKGCCENTSIENENKQGCCENTSLGCSNNTSLGCCENTHNNINNNINDNIITFDLTSKSNGGDQPEEEEIGTLNNPIVVEKQWLAVRANEATQLKDNRWKYGDKIYTFRI